MVKKLMPVLLSARGIVTLAVLWLAAGWLLGAGSTVSAQTDDYSSGSCIVGTNCPGADCLKYCKSSLCNSGRCYCQPGAFGTYGCAFRRI